MTEILNNLPVTFWPGVIGTLVYGVLGILFLIIGFKIFDISLPKVDFQYDIKGNPIAVAIVIAAFLLSLAHIISTVVS